MLVQAVANIRLHAFGMHSAAGCHVWPLEKWHMPNQSKGIYAEAYGRTLVADCSHMPWHRLAFL